MKLRPIETLSCGDKTIILVIKDEFSGVFIETCLGINRVNDTTITYGQDGCGYDYCGAYQSIDKADVKGWIYEDELLKYLQTLEIGETE